MDCTLQLPAPRGMTAPLQPGKAAAAAASPAPAPPAGTLEDFFVQRTRRHVLGADGSDVAVGEHAQAGGGAAARDLLDAVPQLDADLRAILFGCGDVLQPQADTVALLARMVAQHVDVLVRRRCCAATRARLRRPPLGWYGKA